MGLRVDERIVAGGEGDELLVHHLVLRGSNRAIGRHLGELVRARYGLGPPSGGGDPLLAHRRSLRCSAAFVPAPLAGSGHPVVARTFGLAGPLGPTRRGDPPSAGRPYVMELHPDEDLPSLAVCAFDLEGAALDGVNAAGLVVVAAPEVGPHAELPSIAPGSGLHELQVVRRLLDRCATAAEARDALLGGVYGGGRPARWLVADRSGAAFVVEAARGGGLCAQAARAGEPLEVASAADEGPLRTLWHGEYDAARRCLTARFFLGAGDWRRGEAPEVSFQLG